MRFTEGEGSALHARVHGISASDAALSTARTVTLPSPEAAANKVFIIKDEAGTAGTNHIAINGTVDGTTTQAIIVDYGLLEPYSTGAAWFTK